MLFYNHAFFLGPFFSSSLGFLRPKYFLWWNLCGKKRKILSGILSTCTDWSPASCPGEAGERIHRTGSSPPLVSASNLTQQSCPRAILPCHHPCLHLEYEPIFYLQTLRVEKSQLKQSNDGRRICLLLFIIL